MSIPPLPAGVHCAPTEYTVSALPEDHRARRHYTLYVTYRGLGLWAVRNGKDCLDHDGRWVYEMVTVASSAVDEGNEWIKTHRYPLHTALTKAAEAALTMEIMGRHVQDILKETSDE